MASHLNINYQLKKYEGQNLGIAIVKQQSNKHTYYKLATEQPHVLYKANSEQAILCYRNFFR